jgi:hypothetical protein
LLYAHEVGLVPVTTPAYCPQRNGLVEAFVKAFKPDLCGRSGVVGSRVRSRPTQLLDRGPHHPCAALGAPDTEPGPLPGGGALGSTPPASAYLEGELLEEVRETTQAWLKTYNNGLLGDY